MRKHNISYQIHLPTKWLKASWVEEFSSVKQGTGAVEYNTDAIDKPDLFSWIREERFVQVNPRDFRKALRQMCRDQRPGYRPSPLHPELRKLLVDRIAFLGRNLWSCQEAELLIAPPPVAANPPEPSLELSAQQGEPQQQQQGQQQQQQQSQQAQQHGSITNAHKRRASSSSTHAALVHSTISSAGYQQRTSSLQPQSHLSIIPQSSAYAIPAYTDTLQPPPAHRRPVDDAWHQAQTNHQSTSAASSISAPFGHTYEPHPYETRGEAIPLEFMSPLDDDAILRDGLVEFGFGNQDEEEQHQQRQQHQQQIQRIQQQHIQQQQIQQQEQQQTQSPWQAREPGQQQKQKQQQLIQQHRQQQRRKKTVPQPKYPSFDAIDSLLEKTMTDMHLAEFNQVTKLLRHWRMPDVPVRYFTQLEQHATRCFSLPNAVSFLTNETDRFLTGRPDPYANQQAEKLFSVGLTQAQHLIMGIDCTRKVVNCLVEAVELNLPVAHINGIWVNTRDEHRNPCLRLVDMWLPRVMFNGSTFMIMIAPHGTVSLQRNFELFHAPCHPPCVVDKTEN